MLLFYCAAAVRLRTVREKGLRDEEDAGVMLWTSLEAARDACDGRILVIDVSALPAVPDEDATRPSVRVSRVPPEAICNLHPYLAPVPVVAAGGYVVRPGDEAPEVLMIFRRGAWDLPKGKLDADETIEACALREVREEIGVGTLHLGSALGTTLHGYPRDGSYQVKTTYWFLMRTPETHFTPEEREGIETVAWVPWQEAARRVGYPSLRAHMQRIEKIVQEEMRGA